MDERDSSWDSLEFYPDILFHVVDEHRMARRNCLLWKTGRLSETMNRWGSMEPALRHLEPFRRAISINRKSIRCAYTRIHELIAYRLTHSRWREKQKEREKVKEGMSKRGVCSEEIFSYSAMNYIISGRKRLLTREVQAGAASNTVL